jgi:hypothetical protein
LRWYASVVYSESILQKLTPKQLKESMEENEDEYYSDEEDDEGPYEDEEEDDRGDEAPKA